MLIEMMKSKIHRVTVTEANLNYIGSITIDKRLLDAADILPGQRVWIVNNNNGERFDTYVIEGRSPDSGVICLNGAAARKAQLKRCGDYNDLCPAHSRGGKRPGNPR